MASEKLDLDALEALAQKATPGPWKPMVLWQDGAWPVGPYSRNEATAKADAALISALRNALPALLALARRAEKAEAERDAAVAVLREVEWAIEGHRYDCCPRCHGEREYGGHRADCALAAAMAGGT